MKHRVEGIDEKIAGANWDGNVEFLRKMSDSGQFNPLKVTPKEQWNYLHKSNLINPSPAETIRFYLDCGVSVNAQDIYGRTLLHYAMQNKNGNAALLLLEAGANPNTPDIDNITPLGMIGYIPERMDVLQAMLNNGGNVHYKNANSDLEIIELLKIMLNEYHMEYLRPIIKLMEKYI